MTTDERLTKIENDLADLKQEFAKSKGFIGGVVFIVSAGWVFLTTIGPAILKKLGVL